ncbi:MFS transporter [Kribbella sp. NPDC023855]|uniref:MFS transporter n=1 Tax=Kribbella sp. NPDC023855 TaxID=3154698 RepID=UPI003407D79D
MTSDEAGTQQRATLRTALRQRDFSLVAGGQLVSAIGDGILPIAVTLALIARGDGAAAIGGALAARSLAMVVTLMVSGVVVDRFPRTYVMIGADVARVLAVLTIIWCFETGAGAGVITVVMLIFGLGEAFFRPAFRGLYPQLVPEELLQQANAIGSLVTRTAAIAGPALGGILVAWWSPTAALWIDVLTFVVSTGTLLAVRASVRKPTAGRPTIKDFTAGLQAVRRRRWLALTFLSGLIQMPLSVAPWFVLLPIVALDHYGDSDSYPLSMTVYAVGAIVGAMLASRIKTRSPGVPAFVGVAAFGLVMLAMLASVPAAVLVSAHFVAGVGLEVYIVLYYTAVQREVPTELLGRVTALDMMVSAALMPLGYALVGVWAEHAGRSVVLAVGFAACVVTTLPLLLDPQVRSLSSQPDQPPVSTQNGADR